MELEALALFEKSPGAFRLYQILIERLRQRVPGLETRAGKTQISFYLRRQFGCASLLRPRRKADMPTPYLTVTFGLGYPLESPRAAAKTEPYPGRWTHHVVVGSPGDIDGELLDWLEEAAAFAAAKR